MSTSEFDYIGIFGKPIEKTQEEKEKILGLEMKMKSIMEEFHASGGETLTAGIRDGKYVMINQRGEVSSKITYEEYMNNVRKEFASLVDSCKNKKI